MMAGAGPSGAFLSNFDLDEMLWRKLQRLKAQYLDLLIEVRRQIAARAASGNQGEQEQDRTLKMLRGADRAVAMLLARHPGHARAIFQNFGKSVDEFEQEVCSLMSYWLKAAPHAMGPRNRVRAMPPAAMARPTEAERLWQHLQHMLAKYLEPLSKVYEEVRAAAATASENDPGQERALQSVKSHTERMLDTIMAADPDQAMAMRCNFPKGLDVFEQQVEALLSTWEKRRRPGAGPGVTPKTVSVASGISFSVYKKHKALTDWIMDREGSGTSGGRWESEEESSPKQGERTAATVEEESANDKDDETEPLPVGPELAENLLSLMQTVKEEGGVDPEEAEDAEELAGRLSHVCQSKEAVILSPEDVYLLQDYFGEYIFRLDERRNRLDAEGVSQEDQWPIYANIGRAFSMMGPLVQIRRESNLRTLTMGDSAQLGTHDNSDSEGKPA